LSALTGHNNVIIADFKKKSSVFLKKIEKNVKIFEGVRDTQNMYAKFMNYMRHVDKSVLYYTYIVGDLRIKHAYPFVG
jgi:hypothetical protein